MRRLLIRPGAIGDCILAFPALEFLRADYTEVWVPTAVVPLVRFADRVCSISSTGLNLVGLEGVEIPVQLPERLGQFDQVVSWYGANRPEFRSALSRLCADCIFHQALPSFDAVSHAADFFSNQIGAPAGLVPRILVRPPMPRGAIIIHPFSGGITKNWPLASFRKLSPELGTRVEWIAGPEEKLEDANRFENLLELATWMSGAALYIGNDSGITHLAAAAGVQTVALFGSTSPQVWAPRGPRVTVLQQDPIAELTVERVLEVANRLLRSQ